MDLQKNGMNMKTNDTLIQSEQAVIGSLLRDNDSFDEVSDLNPESFIREDHQILCRTIVNFISLGKPVDLIILAEELERQGELERVGGLQYIGAIVQGVNTAKNIKYHVEIVELAAKQRAQKKLLADCGNDLENSIDPQIVAEKAETGLFNLLQSKSVSNMNHIGTAVAEAIDWADAERTGLMTGLRDLDRLTEGFNKGNLIIIAGRPSQGKAQPLDSNILMADGCWKLMGNIKFGDRLASIDGEESRVIAIHPRGELEVFRVTMSDGRSAEVCKDHLWEVNYRDWDSARVVSTEKLMKMLSYKRYQNRLYVNMLSGDFGVTDVPLDGYILGALLGDGGLTGSSIRFTNPDQEVIDEISFRLGDTSRIKRVVGSYAYIITSKDAISRSTEDVLRNGKKWYDRTVYPIRNALKELGLQGLKSEDKFIPDIYLKADKQTRIDLLRGLMDTDGWAEKCATVRYSSASLKLSQGVQSLVRSLGGFCSITKKQTSFIYKGEKKTGLPAYICNIRHSSAQEFFNLPRKKERAVRKTNSSVRLNFTSIVPCRITEVQCITVSHKSHLYVTDEYLVTHNSALAMQIAEHVSKRETVAIFSLEMPKREVATRFINFHESRVGKAQAISHLYSLKLHIDDTSGVSIQHIRSQCRVIKRKHGLSMIVIDYLQLMQGKGDNRTQEIGAISRGLKGLAKEFDIPVVVLSQLMLISVQNLPEFRVKQR